MISLLHPPLPDAGSPRLRWHQLYGSAAALALAEAASADRRLYVLIADGARELERLTAELRFFASRSLALLRLPDWEVLPYDLFSPHPDIISERLQTLYELPHARHGCLIVAADTLMQRLPPRNYVQGRAFGLATGEALAIEPFRQRLIEAGYAHVSQVVSPGEFAVRGSLLDVYPMGTATPLRIDLFDDEIEAIRRFDPDTQRSLEPIASVRLLPAREVPLDAQAVKDFRRRYRTRFEGDPNKSAIYRGVSEGLGARGRGVLPAAVLRGDRDAVRLPAGGRRDRPGRRPARGADQGMAGDRHTLRGSPPRHRASGAQARGIVSRARGARCTARVPSPASPSMPSRRTPSCRANLPACAISRPRRRASCASTCVPSSRLRRWMSSCGPSRGACCWRPTPPAGARCCTRCCVPTPTR